MKFVSGETIAVITKKYVKVYYKELSDDEKSILNEFVTESPYPDLYKCNEQFLHSKYLDNVMVNGKSYMMFACWLTFGDFCPYMPNMYFLGDIPCFAYYEFVDQTNTDGTVGANLKADKMYSCEIDKDDYPEWVNILGKKDLLKLVSKTTKFLYEGNIER